MRALFIFLLVTGSLGAADVLLERGERLYAQADYDAAISTLKQAAPSARSLELLGSSYFMQAEFRKSTEILEKAAVLAPESSTIYTWLGRAYGRRAETSFALNAIGYANKSREAFEKAVRLDPMNKEAVNDLFDFYLEAPGMVGGGSDRARSLLPVIEKCDPENIHWSHARLDEQSKQPDKAEAHLRQALAADPGKPGLVLNLAKFLARHGRYEESEQLFEQAVRLAPDSPRVIFERAESYIQTHRNPERARELLRKYLASNALTPADPPRADARRLLRKVEGS